MKTQDRWFFGAAFFCLVIVFILAAVVQQRQNVKHRIKEREIKSFNELLPQPCEVPMVLENSPTYCAG